MPDDRRGPARVLLQLRQLEIDLGNSANLLVVCNDRLFKSHDGGGSWQPSDAGVTFVGQTSLLATHPAQPGTPYRSTRTPASPPVAPRSDRSVAEHKRLDGVVDWIAVHDVLDLP